VTSLSFLKQILQDVRHQKVRTLLTLLGITWGTVSVALLMAFGEGLEKRIKKNQHGLGENIVIAWPARTALPWQGLGKGRRIRVSEDDIEALRREIPEADFSGEHEKDKVTFRRERVRLSPEMSANNPIFAAMRSLVPAPAAATSTTSTSTAGGAWCSWGTSSRTTSSARRRPSARR
jgi:putative ABC transport system permease protein